MTQKHVINGRVSSHTEKISTKVGNGEKTTGLGTGVDRMDDFYDTRVV
jgi:hypothetical protein